jgi:kynureninase
MNFENTMEFAKSEDEKDILKNFRSQFYIPILNGKDCVYFNGNSLGLQPKTAQDSVLDEMEHWANYGVEGHFYGKNPWANFHEACVKKLQPIVGALSEEIVVMNQLTVNLHLMFTTFYWPDNTRYKIICESGAFSSDYYVIDSQLQLHGLFPEDALIEVAPREGEFIIRNEDIISAIENNAEEVALVFIGGVNYLTGQFFDVKSISDAAHKAGAYCGFDLAHAVGNVELKLHDWEVDFACWCSYKYLNSGPGAVAGTFIHHRYVTDKSLPRLAGWWGTDKHERFQFKREFNAMPTAEGWQLSNANILSMAAHKAALDIFEKAGFENMVAKGKKLSAYLLFILNEINQSASKELVQILTPVDAQEHGCQVSLILPENGKGFFDSLNRNSVIADWKEPGIIRVAPVPLYNTFEEVFLFGKILKDFADTNGKG